MLRWTRWTRLPIACTLGALVFGCVDDNPIATERSVAAGDPVEDLGGPPAVNQALDLVARGIALAMEDESIRIAVRDAMRDSPWDEHQLDLHEFLETDRGQMVAQVAIEGLDIPFDRFADAIRSLPAMDFYVPYRDHRRTWTGARPVTVVAALNSDDGPFLGFDHTGHRIDPPSSRPIPVVPVVGLYPAERRIRRQESALQDASQEVIEGPSEDTPGVFSWIEPDGTVLTSTYDDVISGRDPRFQVANMSLSSSMVPADTTFLDRVEIFFCDGAGDVELRLEAEFYHEDGTLDGTGVYYVGDFAPPDPCDGTNPSYRNPHYPLIFRVTPDSTNHRVHIEVWEDDCGCFGNDDDYKGARDFYWDDRAELRSIPPAGHTNANVELDWSPLPPSVLSAVSLSPDPVEVRPGDRAFVYGRALDQYGYGLSGYSVDSWYTDHSWIATAGPLTGNPMDGWVDGGSTGSTMVHADVDGFVGDADVEVLEDCDPETDPDCGA